VKAWSQVQRFFCQGCKKSFTRLTEFLLPFKHYIVTEIEGALQHIFKGGELSKAPSGASESTLRRWRNEYQPKIQEWSGRLEDLMIGQCRTPDLLRLTFDPLARLAEVNTRLPPLLPGNWPVMVKTLWWLAKSHPL
jgi:hypothetical protein